ncbi:unnamed protein product [Ectocarpus fasciculatus]
MGRPDSTSDGAVRSATTAPPSPSSSSAWSTAASSAVVPAFAGVREQEPSSTMSPARRRGVGGEGAGSAPSSAAPVAEARAASHKIVRLAPRVYQVPTLRYCCVQVLAEHADKIVDLRGVGQDTARQLLEEIMGRQKLTYPLAKVFMNCGDDELSRQARSIVAVQLAIASLNLWDAIPAGRQGRHSRHL